MKSDCEKKNKNENNKPYFFTSLRNAKNVMLWNLPITNHIFIKSNLSDKFIIIILLMKLSFILEFYTIIFFQINFLNGFIWLWFCLWSLLPFF